MGGDFRLESALIHPSPSFAMSSAAEWPERRAQYEGDRVGKEDDDEARARIDTTHKFG